jgi:hypothetical protein
MSLDERILRIDLSIANRSSVIAAGCVMLAMGGTKNAAIGKWREGAERLDMLALLFEVEKLGCCFTLGNRPFALPALIRARRSA